MIASILQPSFLSFPFLSFPLSFQGYELCDSVIITPKMTNITVVDTQYLITVLANSPNFLVVIILLGRTKGQTYLNTQTIHTRHIFDSISIDAMGTNLIMTESACEKFVTFWTHHLCTSIIVGTT